MSSNYNDNLDIDSILNEFLSETGTAVKNEAEHENHAQPVEVSEDYDEETQVNEEDYSENFTTVYSKPDNGGVSSTNSKSDSHNVSRVKKHARSDSSMQKTTRGLASVIGAAVSLILIAFVAVYVHPASTVSIKTEKTKGNASLGSKIESVINNSKADMLKNLTVIKKIYTIPESATSAPSPNPSSFGEVSTDNASEINKVIELARSYGLLEQDEQVAFNPNAEFYYDENIKYYIDESIMAICWKEVIDGNTCSFSEIKVADASQFRRKFVNDTFGSDSQDYCSNIAKSVNAVVAMNADYYAFRDFGMVVYNRELYRMSDEHYMDNYMKYNCVDTMFIDGNGDMKFFHAGDVLTENAMKNYISDNDIIFSISFGPIIVENGQRVYCESYPVGEVNLGYSRAGLGQMGNLHYLYMSLNHSPEKEARWTVNTFADHFYERGVVNAYCFDGGQTSELVFQYEPYNRIDFGAERTVTDIIYFATAIEGFE